ncbi:Uncharacterised protein [Bacteroides heparinolyticus]|uniref:Uncharacterized protein n=1 Tax=Prevotella heparinolytica TaxID=28113 RepID=A0A449I698_9BACE|nr:Uncharacterised protein [Bacteroides heparinolyticus]
MGLSQARNFAYFTALVKNKPCQMPQNPRLPLWHRTTDFCFRLSPAYNLKGRISFPSQQYR